MKQVDVLIGLRTNGTVHYFCKGMSATDKRADDITVSIDGVRCRFVPKAVIPPPALSPQRTDWIERNGNSRYTAVLGERLRRDSSWRAFTEPESAMFARVLPVCPQEPR